MIVSVNDQHYRNGYHKFHAIPRGSIALARYTTEVNVSLSFILFDLSPRVQYTQVCSADHRCSPPEIDNFSRAIYKTPLLLSARASDSRGNKVPRV